MCWCFRSQADKTSVKLFLLVLAHPPRQATVVVAPKADEATHLRSSRTLWEIPSEDL